MIREREPAGQLALPFSAPTRRSGKCRRCGRALKNPASVERGYGPVCAAMVAADMQEEQMKEHSDYPIDEPITNGIILQRNEDGVGTNVPHYATHHSPDGFEFGYGGSGPADLALNAVEAILRSMGYQGEKTEPLWDKRQVFRAAWKLHQGFKWHFIGGIGRNFGTFTISYAEAREWIESKLREIPADNDGDDFAY